jgi:hypothetical protein
LQFPGAIGNDKVVRMSDLAIRCVNAISCHMKNTLQMQINCRLIVLFKGLLNYVSLEYN